MSHQHERKEKKCLNCGTDLYDRFCHKCGQENVEPRQSFWQLTVHFFEDLTHFDGKFFTTVKYMFTKPGFLTSEYVNGKRAAYVNPIRMYLFVSAMFFIISGMLPDISDSGGIKPVIRSADTDTKADTALRNIHAIDTTMLDSVIQDSVYYGRTLSNASTVAIYDSIANNLPADKRPNFLSKYIGRRLAAFREKSHAIPNFEEKILDKFFHSIPAILFFSVPLIAFLLQLLYIRKRKEYYYVGHIIFLTHYYCFAFIALLLVKTASYLGSYSSYVKIPLVLGAIFYLYKSMKGYYKQGIFKTFVKFLLLFILGLMIISVLTVLAFLNSLLISSAH